MIYRNPIPSSRELLDPSETVHISLEGQSVRPRDLDHDFEAISSRPNFLLK